MNSTARLVRGAVARWWQGDEPPIEALFCGLLSIAYAFGFAMLLVWLRTPFNEPREWQIFVVGWLLVPLLTLGAVVIVLARDAGDHRTRLGGLALSQSLVVVISAALLRLAADAEPPATISTFRAIACIAPSLVAVLGIICPLSWLSIPSRPGPAVSLALLLVAATLLALFEPPSLLRIVLVTGGSGLLVLLRETYSRFLPNQFVTHPLDPRLLRLVDLGVVGFIAWLLFDPHFHFDQHHANWFLGPAHQVLQGATMLVDVVCAYGVLSIYFLAGALALWPLPMSYFALGATVLLLLIAQYTTFYVLLRHLGVSWAHAALALGVVFIANFIALDGAIGSYPSLGPIRFGLPYILLILVALRRHRIGWTHFTRIAESIVVAAASLWSLETFAFTFPTYLAIVVLEAGFAARVTPRRSPGWLATATRRLAATVIAIAVTHATFAVFVHLRVGIWPDWPSYFALVSVYTPAGMGLLLIPIPALGHWVAVMFVYAASALACLFVAPRTRRYQDQVALVVVFGATAMGVAQFSIYVGMSSAYRLASAVMPAVFVAVYWVDRLRRSTSTGRAPGRVAALVAYATAALTLLHFEEPFRDWLAHDSHQSIGRGFFAQRKAGCAAFPDCLFAPPIVGPMTQTAVSLINRYASHGENVALLLDDLSTTEVLMRTGRRNALPTTGTIQDGLVQRNADRVVNAPHQLAAGDILLWEAILENESPVFIGIKTKAIPQKLLKRVCEEFNCRELRRLNGIVVTRLTARNSSYGK